MAKWGPRLTYDQWKAEVDKIVQAKVGCCCDDLPDWDYSTAFDNKVAPMAAANAVIKAAKGF